MHFVSASNLAFSLGGRGTRDSSGARSTGNTVLQRKNRMEWALQNLVAVLFLPTKVSSPKIKPSWIKNKRNKSHG